MRKRSPYNSKYFDSETAIVSTGCCLGGVVSLLWYAFVIFVLVMLAADFFDLGIAITDKI